MAPIADLDRLRCYRDALCNWKFTGYIQFELTQQADRWIRTELDDIWYFDIKRLMYEYVFLDNGVIDEQPEKRAEWADRYEFHHDLRFAIQAKPVYIETRLNYRLPFTPDESWILVVNVHSPS